MGVTDRISAADVALDLQVGDKHALLRALATGAASRLGRPAGEVLDAVQARERLGSTALGRGVALPHARLAGNDPPVVVFARLRRPIDYEARDEEPVDLVILVLWPEASPAGFLPALSGIVGALRDPRMLRRLRRAGTPKEAAALLREGAFPPAGKPFAPGAG